MATDPDNAQAGGTPPTDQTPAPQQREPRPAPLQAGGALAAMIPQTSEEYGRMAELLIYAECVPASYAPKEGAFASQEAFKKTRAALIIGLMKSVEIGVPPLTGINGIMIVNNRPSVWGDLAVALVQRDGHLAKMEVRKIGPEPIPGTPLDQWDRGFGFRVLMWRRGQETPYEGTFTVGDARRAGLWENTRKQPWINYPLDMLFNRARAKAMRAGFSDSLHGMSIVEEARDVAPEPQKISAASILNDEPEPPAAPAIEHQPQPPAQDFGTAEAREALSNEPGEQKDKLL